MPAAPIAPVIGVAATSNLSKLAEKGGFGVRDEVPIGPELTRRALLATSGAAALAMAAGLPASAQAPVTVAQFLALSSKLTGKPGLDPGIAKKLLDGFVATGKGADLAALVGTGGNATVKTRPLANAVVANWYCGVYDTAGGQAVAGFDTALMWDAMRFTKPFGVCGGDAGYWANPPDL